MLYQALGRTIVYLHSDEFFVESMFCILQARLNLCPPEYPDHSLMQHEAFHLNPSL